MAKEKLKPLPCPFCGGKADSHYYTSEWWAEDKKEYQVECRNEECEVFVRTHGFATEIGAIKAWNRRVEGAEYVKMLNNVVIRELR